ncbi:VanZ family protein [Phycisphaeraceae bacterium D3-23]
MPEPDSDPPAPSRLTLLALRAGLVVYWATLAALTHWPSLSAVESPIRAADDPYRLMQQDKPAHLLVFGGLAVLLILAKPFGKHRSHIATALLATGVALVYAVIDEVTQGFFADRTVSHSDVLANFIGITGVLLLALTPARDPRPTAWVDWKASVRGVSYLGAFALGGALLAATRMVGRETYAIHAVVAAWITLALLRGTPVVPRSPRLRALLVCGAVAATVALGEIAQAFSGMMFSQSEVLYGEIGLLVAMLLWSARLAFVDPLAEVQHKATTAQPDAEATAGDAVALDPEPDAVPAPSSRA